MELIIKRLIGDEKRLVVSGDSTVGELKQLISQLFNVPPYKQKLSSEIGHRINLEDDSRSLSSYGLHSGSVVILLITNSPTAPHAPLQVFVINEKGQIKTYDVDVNETVDQLQTKICRKEGVQKNQQRLIYSGRQLEAGMKLRDYGITPGSTIHMTLRSVQQKSSNPQSSYVSMKSDVYMDLPIKFKSGDTRPDLSSVQQKSSNPQSSYVSMKSDVSMDPPIKFKSGDTRPDLSLRADGTGTSYEESKQNAAKRTWSEHLDQTVWTTQSSEDDTSSQSQETQKSKDARLSSNSLCETPSSSDSIVFKDSSSGGSPMAISPNISNISEHNLKSSGFQPSNEATKSRFLDDFDSINPLGKGGFGRVFKARQKLENKYYAVKIVKSREKALREVRALSDFNNANIVRYYAAWVEDMPYIHESSSESFSDSGSEPETKFLYIQMELCEEDTLRAWINKRNSSNEHFPERRVDAAQISRQLLTAVEYIHSKGLIHRDLKPENILFSMDGRVKVGDFGFVTAAENDNDKQLLERTKRKGTRTYMSPEQVTQTFYDRKVDIYALGLIYFELIYNLVTGHEKRKIWDDIRRRDFPSQFSRKFSFEHKFIDRMLSASPEDRPDAKDLIRELDQHTKVHSPYVAEPKRCASNCDAITLSMETADHDKQLRKTENPADTLHNKVMKLIIKLLTGDVKQLVVNGDATVGELKQRISQHFNVPPYKQKLFSENCHSISLEDDSRSLSSYGLHSGSVVMLLITNSPPAPLQVFVINEQGLIKTYDVDVNETVDQLQTKIFQKERVPKDQQRLIYSGRQLEAGMKLQYYGITPGSTIHMTLQLRGA